MLLTLHRLACRLLWCRPLAIILVLAGLGGSLFSLFIAAEEWGHLFEPSLVLTLWGMMLFSFLQLFRRIPPPVLPRDDFMARLGSRIILACYSILALLVVVVSCILLWMSFRLIYLD